MNYQNKLKLFSIITFLLFTGVVFTGCGADDVVNVQCPESGCVPAPATPVPTPVPTQQPKPETTPSEPKTETKKAPAERHFVRFYYVVEDEVVDNVDCSIKTTGLEMEYQIRNLTQEKFEILKNRSYCEITDITEGSENVGKSYEIRCDLTDNYIWVDETCNTSTVQYRHYYRPNLASWGPSAMPEPEYRYGGTSR